MKRLLLGLLLISFLIVAGVSASTQVNYTASKGGVVNGGFETGTGTATASGWVGSENYGWYAYYDTLTGFVMFDANYSHSGSKSLLISSTGSASSGKFISAQNLGNEAPYTRNLIPVKPSTVYRVSYWIKTTSVSTGVSQGATLSLDEFTETAYNSVSYNTVGGYTTGTNDWSQKSYTWTTASGTTRLKIREKLVGETGSAYYDDIQIEEIVTDTQSTAQVVKPVVQGVTSVDNIDQSLDSGWAAANTYALTNAVNEGATHIQTFTPTKAKITNISINCVATGTAVTWTLAVHDASNNVLSSNTITPVAGVNSIPVPTLWTSGNLHFHVYASATTGTPTLKAASANDLETGSYIEYYAKNTEDVSVTVNGVTANLISNGTAVGDATGLLSGAIVDTDKGFYNWTSSRSTTDSTSPLSIYSASAGGNSIGANPIVGNGWIYFQNSDITLLGSANDATSRVMIYKFNTMLPITGISINSTIYSSSTNSKKLDISLDGSSWTELRNVTGTGAVYYSAANSTDIANGATTFYLRFIKTGTSQFYIGLNSVNATLNTTGLPTQSVIAGTNYYNISSNGRADSASLDPSMLVDVWLMGQPPASSFTSNVSSGIAPLPVHFTDTSTGYPTSWSWKVNGTQVATTQNLDYTFVPQGTHIVNLTATNSGGSSISTDKYIYANATLIADFVGAPLSGHATTDVSFVDFSVGAGIYSWDWTFGDGGTSTERNPTHPYSTAGTFDVSLTIDGDDGTNTTTMLAYITITEASDINPDSTYRFKPDNNIISNLTLYNRTIEMGNVNNATYALGSTLFDKDHIRVMRVLPNATTYGDIVLTSYSMDNTTGIVNWNVTRPGGFAPIAAFVPILDIEMLYDRYSPGVTGAAWGSGTLINGTYRNSFPVTNLLDSPLTYSWTTYSNFSVDNNAPIIFEDTVTFTPIELNFTPNRWLWDFGDGNTTLLTTPSSIAHIYTGTPGTLNPSLTAYRSENTAVTNTTTLYGAIVAAYNTSYVHADFSATPITGTPGVAVSFTDLSQWGSTDAVSGRTYNWSFGDGLYSSSPYSDVTGDVLHVYPTVGVYSVNLTVNNTIDSDHVEKLNHITVAISQVQQTTWYTPKQIGITAVYRDPAGIRIPNTTLTVTAIGSSIPTTATTSMGESLQALYGINPTAANLMLNNTLIMSGTTGGDGSVAFIVVATISYSVAVTDPATGLVWTTTLFPSDPTGLYTVWVGELPYASLGNTTLTHMNATRVYYTQPDIGNVTFHVDYQDISGYTTNVLFEIIDAGNMTTVYSANLGAPGTGVLQANYTLPNKMGYTYYWGYNATRDTP